MKMTKKILAVLTVIVFSLTLTACKNSDTYKEALSLQEDGSYEEAIKLYNTISDDERATENAKLCEYALEVTQKNEELEAAIMEATEAIEDERPAMNETLRTNLQGYVSEAEESEYVIDSKNLTEELKDVDYTDIIATLTKETSKLNQSINAKAIGTSIVDTAKDTWDVIGGDQMVDDATNYVKDIFGVSD